MKLNKFLYIGVLSAGLLATSCEDFLDRAPISSLTPENYYKSEAELAAYTLNYYGSVFKSPGFGGYSAGPINMDDETDNMVVGGGNTSYYDHQWLVGAGEALDFGFIRACNYFFQQVLPKKEEGAISGDAEKINHYIGEMYFMRAMAYFAKLKTYGDFPIIKDVLVDDMAVLREASRRSPRNEVAKFIISDLETAEDLLMSGSAFNKNRIGKELATLVKARVALYEATFLKYHSGTPRVPGEAGWPGANKHYNSGKTFNIASDVDYFLTVAMEASKEIAEATTLTPNNGVLNPEPGQITGWNPYYEMFSMDDPSDLSEVILWRDYNKAQSVVNGWNPYIQEGGNNGMTKSYVDAYLMANGLPIYAAGSGYQGDETIDLQMTDRDGRLQLFLFGESTILRNDGTKYSQFEAPGLLFMTEHRDLTGFRQRKHFTYDQIQISDGINGTNAYVEYRGAEAYLIYIEASYLKNGSIDATADKYWRAIRERGGVDPDYNKTIAATDLAQEPDWAKYSGSELVDATLYNIRRERRCEFIAEGFRWDDLVRWRAFDGLLEGGEFHGYIPQGVNFWTSMYLHESYYDETTGECNLNEQADGNGSANISSREFSKYVCPYHTIRENNQLWDGLKWQKAHYLSPLGVKDLTLTSEDDSIENSESYQNPYWPTRASEAATE